MRDCHHYRVGSEGAEVTTTWLHRHVGRPAGDRYDLRADWIWLINTRLGVSEDRYKVTIRDVNKAMLYKLTWV